MKLRILAVLLGIAVFASAALSAAEEAPVTDDFDLSDYAGKVVYVDFWASWCGPCRASFPFMADMVREFGDDLTIVAINVDEQRTDADGFLADFETPFDIVYDPAGTLASLFKVPGMPTSYLYDRNGQFIERHIGFRSSDKAAIREKIERAIATTTLAESDAE